MKINRLLFTVIFLNCCLINAFGQKMVTLDKRLNDRSGEYGKAIAPFFENKPGDAAKQKALKPFVIGFYGWKSMKLTELGVGQIEAAHLDICRIILGLYDPEIDQTLKTIVGRAKTPTDWIDVSEAERKTIQKYVVMKYGGDYTGINAAISGNYNRQPDEIEKWKYNFGGAMGELAGHLTNWYKLPNNPSYHKKISEDLLSLQKQITSAPNGIPAEILNNTKKLSALGNKTQFNEIERDNIAAAVKDVLFSTVSFTNSANSSTTAISTSTPLRNADAYLEKGKTFAAKGDYQNAVTNYNEAISLDITNGMAYYYRAKALEELGKIDEAIKDYVMMIALKTDLKRAYYNRGTLYLEKKNYYIAIDDFDKSLAIDPKYVNAYYNRGQSYYYLSKFDKALADFSQAIILDPNETDSYINRALIYCQTGKTNLALIDQEKAIKLGGKITKGCE